MQTADDLWALSQGRDDGGKLLELVDGVIVEMPPAFALESVVASRIGVAVLTHVDDREMGYVTAARGGVELSPNDVLAPDCAYISKARVPELPERYFQGAPDLAIEVVSPTDSIPDVLRKARKYLQYGTKRVWIFYPDDESAHVCRLAPDGGMIVDEVSMDGVLDGEDALPGFRLALREVFPKKD